MTLTEDLTGRTLGKYALRERIGRGGMAEVYKAYQEALDRFVAVKVLHAFLSEDDEFKSRFEREAKNIAKLRHNHIVQVYDFAFEPGPDLYYMVMEFVDGPTLRNILLQKEAKGERLSVLEVTRIARDLASALAYAHQNDMIHRDIKPGNIMLDKDGRVVLTDFGIAKIVSGQHITASGTMIGTPAYMAPEQGLGQPGDHRSDIYSLGVVMYQLAAGTPPYEADTPIALVLKHVNDPLPPLSTFSTNLPEGLERIIYKSLAKDPDERFQDAQELADLLGDLESAARITVPEATPEQATILRTEPKQTIVTDKPSVGERIAGLRNINPYAGVGIGVAVVAAIAAGALLLGGGSGPGEPGGTAEAIITTETAAPSAVAGGAEEPEQTEEPIATTDLEATALVATLDIIRARRATQIALATQPSDGTGLPPLVMPGCIYDYKVLTESPRLDAPILENSNITKRVEVKNVGECTWELGTTLEFLDGLQMEAPDEIVLEEVIRPGQSATFEFELVVPPFSANDRVAQSTWRLVTPDGQRIGRLYTFNIEIVPPTATPTPTPPPTATAPPSPTPTITPTIDPTINALLLATLNAQTESAPPDGG